jgi:nicotinate phosphoribosyltransferase
MIERNAYIGGCDGVAVVKSGEMIGEDPMGTMPHALIILMGNSVEAVRAFHEVIDPRIKRVALVDTFGDEKFETLGVAEALGKDLFAVRLDTPASRRGDFYRILQEVRWELDLRGFREVRLYASGGLDEKEIFRLNPLVDAYGVGTSISNAPVVDFAMDIVEVEGKPLAKRGKMSGSKRVLRCHQCYRDRLVPLSQTPGKCECGGTERDLLQGFVDDPGKRPGTLPPPRKIREYVLEQAPHFKLNCDQGESG